MVKFAGFNKKKEQGTFKERFIASFRRSYTISVFLVFMVVGWLLDLLMDTMPTFSLTGMVLGAVVGSCVTVKKRNEAKSEEDIKGKKLL